MFGMGPTALTGIKMNQAVAMKKKSVFPKFAVAMPVAVLALAAAAYVAMRPGTAQGVGGLSFHTVDERSMDVTIRKDGELQAVNNTEIACEVEGSTTITFLVKEGASVKRGDVLVELDSSVIRQKIEDTTLELQKAEADLITSREMLEIQKSQNATNLESAQVTLELAQIALKKYEQGDYPKALADAEVAVKMAEIDLENKVADFKQVQELAAKQFLTPTDVLQREVALLEARNKVASAQSTLRNLTTFELQANMSQKRNDLATAEQRLVRVQRENSANRAQREADLGAKEQSVTLIKRKLERYKAQFIACTIRAPEDGLVVYATSGDRNAQSQIQEGAQVRERQMILRLPDTARMKAVVRIQESQVTRLREGQRALVSITGNPKPLMGTVTKISVLADSGQRWFNPDLKEYPVDIELDETPQGLKPGVGATSEIYIARLEDVTAVPVSTIYSSGSKSYVFIRPTGEGSPVPRVVQLGMANETFVTVQEGVKPGEQVLVLQAGQGRELLQKAGIADEPATRPTFGPGGPRRRPGNGEGGPGGGGPGGGQGNGPGGAAMVAPGGAAGQGGGGGGRGGMESSPGAHGENGVGGGSPEGAPQGERRRRRPPGGEPGAAGPQSNTSIAPATRPAAVGSISG